MSRKREVLEFLRRSDLQEIADSFDLEVVDRRSKEHLVNAVARSKKAKLREILESLSRDTLKDICRSLELDDTGREKAVLIDRITGDSPNSESTEALQMELPASGKLTVDQLEKNLWSAADILRGSIDSSDYKNFIFGILFLKRLSDVFEEAADTSDGEEHIDVAAAVVKLRELQKERGEAEERMNAYLGELGYGA